MGDATHEIFLVNPGPRPPYRDVADALWGRGCDVDSDGDSARPEAVDWTELTLILRPDCLTRLDIDPVEGTDQLVLWLRSEQEQIVRKAAEFLVKHSGGTIAPNRP